MLRRASRIAVVGLCALVLSCGALQLVAPSRAAATSAPSWTPAEAFSQQTRSEVNRTTAMSADGQTAAQVWAYTPTADANPVVYAAVRVAGAWTAPQQLSDNGAIASIGNVAVSADGSTVAVVWDTYTKDKSNDGIYVAVAHNGVFAPEIALGTDLASPLPLFFVGEGVALSADGSQAIVAWMQYPNSWNSSGTSQALVSTLSHGQWSTPTQLPSVGQGSVHDVSISSDGHRRAVLTGDYNQGVLAVRVASAIDEGPWSSVQVSPPDRNVWSYSFAMSADGTHGIVAWTTNGTVLGAATLHNGCWQPRVALGPFSSVQISNVAMSADGSTDAIGWVSAGAWQAATSNAPRGPGEYVQVSIQGTLLPIHYVGLDSYPAPLSNDWVAAASNRVAVIWPGPDALHPVGASLNAQIFDGKTWSPMPLPVPADQAPVSPRIGLSADGRTLAASWLNGVDDSTNVTGLHQGFATFGTLLPADALPPVTAPAPTLDSIEPAVGSLIQPKQVTVHGLWLSGAAVTFDGLPGRVVKSNGFEVIVVPPGHRPGSVTVTVTTPGGQVTLAKAYRYVGIAGKLSSS